MMSYSDSFPSHTSKGDWKQLTADPGFELFTSLRYDPALTDLQEEYFNGTILDRQSSFYLLSFHFDRLLFAAQLFNFPTSCLAISEKRLELKNWLLSEIQFSEHPLTLTARIRISLNCHAGFSMTIMPTAAVSMHTLFPNKLAAPPIASSQPHWTIYVSPTPIEPSPLTLCKTSHRSMYDTARSILPAPSTGDSEVLLYNSEGEISESSITTPYFFRDGRWITPPLSSGGNAGTTRRWALERRLCTEGIVLVTRLLDGEECWLSNGVRGFFPGTVHLPKEPLS